MPSHPQGMSTILIQSWSQEFVTNSFLSAQIVNALSESIYVSDTGGPHVFAYGPVMGIATAIIAVGIAVTVSVGPERKGRKFEVTPVVGEHDIKKDIEMGEASDDDKNVTSQVEVIDHKH